MLLGKVELIYVTLNIVLEAECVFLFQFGVTVGLSLSQGDGSISTQPLGLAQKTSHALVHALSSLAS